MFGPCCDRRTLVSPPGGAAEGDRGKEGRNGNSARNGSNSERNGERAKEGRGGKAKVLTLGESSNHLWVNEIEY